MQRRPLHYIRWNKLIFHPNNMPITAPGVYLLTNVVTGCNYVGATLDVWERLHQYRRGSANTKAIEAAFRRGEQFIAQPLYYSLELRPYTKQSLGLAQIEEMLIETWNGYSGYNKPRADIASLAELPAAKAKRMTREQSEETKIRRSTVMLARWANPDYKARVTANIRIAVVKRDNQRFVTVLKR